MISTWPGVHSLSEASMPLPVQFVVIFIRPHSDVGLKVGVIKPL